jgi:DNA mismatch repair protein MutS
VKRNFYEKSHKKKEIVKCSYQNEILKKVFFSRDLSTRGAVHNNMTNSEPSMILTPIESLELERYPMLVTAYVILLDYIYLHNERVLYRITKPDIDTISDHMLIENDAAAQLNITDSNGLCNGSMNVSMNGSMNGSMKPVYDSVYSVINACQTPVGKKFLRGQLLKPLISSKKIIERHCASEFVMPVHQDIRNSLSSIGSTEKIVRRMALGILNPYEMSHMSKILKNLQTVLDLLHSG